jgi:hypothetical protein
MSTLAKTSKSLQDPITVALQKERTDGTGGLTAPTFRLFLSLPKLQASEEA